MSSLICLTCKEPVTDMRSAISVNEFKNLAAMHLVHKSCYFCSKCSTPLNPENAFVSDESKLLCLSHQLSSLWPDCALCGVKCSDDLVVENGMAFHNGCYQKIMQETTSLDASSLNLNEDSRLKVLTVNNPDNLFTGIPSPEEGFYEMSPPSQPEYQSLVIGEFQLGEEAVDCPPDQFKLFEAQNVQFHNLELHAIDPEITEAQRQNEAGSPDSGCPEMQLLPEIEIAPDSVLQREQVDQIMNEFLTEVEAAPQAHLETQSQVNFFAEPQFISAQSVGYGHDQPELYSEFHLQNTLPPYNVKQESQIMFEDYSYIAHSKPAEFQMTQTGVFPLQRNNNATAQQCYAQGFRSDQICTVQNSQDPSQHVFKIVKSEQSGVFQLARVNQNNDQFSFGQFQTLNPSRLMAPMVQEVQIAVAKKSKPPTEEHQVSQSGSRRRCTITEDTKAILFTSFNVSPFPSRAQRIELGNLTGLDQRQVQIWFQNERSKARKSGKVGYSLKTKENIAPRAGPRSNNF